MLGVSIRNCAGCPGRGRSGSRRSGSEGCR
ncbi:UNVERIFIED_CONTAM: hypothetical protein GTU68_049608 [Idotea baltica]|nr:hypothetical protein [Idotea baltica]